MILGGFDLETTGLDFNDHRIIEISLILYHWPSRRELLNFTRRIYPGRSIDPKAQAVHRIALEDLEGCPTFEQMAEQVNKILAKCNVLVAHNAMSFDVPFLAAELNRVKQPVPTHLSVVDTLDSRWATPDGKKPKLMELAFALGVDYDTEQAHAAEYDVRVMMECLFRGIDMGFFALPNQESEDHQAA
tara:strand:- start:1502 stop:2065 length:564 start_codon:yes stop_codon:yes gene_type:complete